MTTGHDHRYALPPGHRLGEYRIDRYLGSGGFGITYLATDENLNLQVAIKEYLPSDLAMRDADNSVVVKTTEDEDDFEWGRERFLDEARSLARFNHPNIVRVQRFFEAHGTSHIVMDYVEGEPLSDLLERKGTLMEAEIHQLVVPLASGLADIHGAGLLHRDIKPSNIILRNGGTPVLIDFGSARQAVGMKSRSVTSVVTPGYAPLEQYATKSRQGPATDIYAFGAVLYRCVTGRRPDDATERAIEDALAPAAKACVGGYSKGLLAAIDAALALRMEDRPDNIAKFLYGLEEPTAPLMPKGGNQTEFVSSLGTSAEGTADLATDLLVQFPEVSCSYPSLPGGAAMYCETTDQGHANTEYNLDSTYSDKEGSPKALAQVATRLRRAAKQGHAGAQYNLGLMYYRGEGVRENFAKAATWLRKAAEQGHAYAQCDLGGLMYWGSGDHPKSEKLYQAIAWLRKAAEQGHSHAQHTLGGLMYWGDRYGAAHAPKDHPQAALWFRKAAEQGHVHAQCNLGGLKYWGGESIAKDYAQAAVWFHKAAEQGDWRGQNNLGALYQNGEGVPRDHAQAAIWFRKAAEQGGLKAQNNLGALLYQHAERGSNDHSQAVVWFRKAAEQGDPMAQNNLGVLYQRGEGVPKDHAQATVWFRKATEKGLAEAQLNLGTQYFRGEGTPKNIVQAYAWYLLATRCGSSKGPAALGVVGRTMTPSQVTEARALSLDLESLMPVDCFRWTVLEAEKLEAE